MGSMTQWSFQSYCSKLKHLCQVPENSHPDQWLLKLSGFNRDKRYKIDVRVILETELSCLQKIDTILKFLHTTP